MLPNQINNFDHYIKDNGIEIVKCKIIKDRLPYKGHEYKVTLRNKTRKKLKVWYIIPFVTVLGPTVRDVLYSIVEEAQIFDNNQGFNEWLKCVTDGYIKENQIPKARKLYRELIKFVRKLKKFTGDSYSDLLACKERN